VRLRALPVSGDATVQPVLVGGVVHAVDGRTVTVGAAGGVRFALPESASVPPVGTLVSFWVDRAVLAQPQPWGVRGGRRPLVFRNACKVARAEHLLTGFSGWAPALLRTGAGAVSVGELTSSWTPLPGHTAVLPAGANAASDNGAPPGNANARMNLTHSASQKRKPVTAN
jgi:hypothetical protein